MAAIDRPCPRTFAHPRDRRPTSVRAPSRFHRRARGRPHARFPRRASRSATRRRRPVAAGAATTDHPEHGAPGPPFVGRERELVGLRDQLEAILAGYGGVALLAGEPGIGKSRTARCLADLTKARGGQVLWGRCFDAEWTPPLAPWLEAVGRWAADHDPDRLRAELGPPAAAAALAALVPAIRAALPALPPPAPLSADEERVRAYDAVADLLLGLARRQPLLLVLDDLHWSDAASLELLRYLGRSLATAPLLVLGAYRGDEIGGHHPLSAILADLHRETPLRLYALGGLDRRETGELLHRLAGEPVASSLVGAIHAETEGNPFFVRELFRHLAEERRLAPTADRGEPALGAGITLAGVIPEGVRQVVGRRLARLGAGANRLLSHAAIASGGFDFRLLQALTGMDETALLDALDEALASGLLRSVDERREAYDFVHAIVRHTLAAEWSPSRKLRLHRRLAEALEQTDPDDRAGHAAELALQYDASAALPGAAKGVPPALTAADAARAAGDRAGAVRFLRIARDLAVDPDPIARAGLLTKLALAEADALLLADARTTVEAAIVAMEEVDTPPTAIADFLGAMAIALDEGGIAVANWRPLVERGLALLGDQRDVTWARLMLARKPFAPLGAGPIRAARWLGSDPTAVALARAAGDEDDFARTIQPFDDRGPAETRALLGRARRWRQPAATIRVLTMIGADWLYHHGDLAEAIAAFEELRAVAERHGSVAALAEALIRLALVRIDLGEHEAAQQLAAEAGSALARLGPGHHLRPSAAWIDALLADHLTDDPAVWEGIAEFWEGYVLDPRAADNALVVDDAALAAYAHARAGHPADAHRLLLALTPLLDRPRPTDWLLNGAVAFGAAALWWMTTSPAAGGDAPTRLVEHFRRLARDLVAAERGDYPGTSNDLALARMAAFLDQPAEASEHFARARLAAAASRRQPLAAIADHDEALAILRWNRTTAEPNRASSLLASAERRFRVLGMTPWAERAATLAATAARRPASGSIPYPGGLSDREIDVLRLVAQGCSDRVIGDRLFLSPRTINAHVRNMLRKTDRANRTELSVWAMEQGLNAR